MLFLFSPRGMGIAPIIKLSVVNGTCLPLLFLPRFHGFGTNKSQPTGRVDRCRILERGLELVKDAPEAFGVVLQEGTDVLRAFLEVARTTGQGEV